MAFDIEACRQEFRRLDRCDGAWRTDRIPTKEDIHARWHWQTEKAVPDPAAADIGRCSALISGHGKCMPRNDVVPLERRFRYPPMPLEWFDNEPARRVFRKPDPEHRLLASLSGKHLAGYTGRPSGAQLFAWLLEGTKAEEERNWLNELLQDIREEDYPQLRRRDALSAWHIARAVLESGVRRGALSRWLNQFAERPKGWQGEVPGENPLPTPFVRSTAT